MKIITVCGSLKFKEEMMREAIRLELEGNIVLTPLFPLKEEDMPTKEEGDLLGNMHKEKIKISDGIFVINVGGYIGESTKSEIALAKSLHKEVKYLEEIKKKKKKVILFERNNFLIKLFDCKISIYYIESSAKKLHF